MTSSEPEDPAERTDSSSARPAENRSSDSPVARRAELPGDVDAAFAAIVAGWAADGAPRWPGDGGENAGGRPDDLPPARDGRTGADRSDDGPSSGVGTATPPHGWDTTGGPGPVEAPGPLAGPRRTPADGPPPPRAPQAPAPAGPADEEFVPPEPPPLPRPRFGAVLGLALLVVGVVMLAVPSLLGAPLGLGIVPGLLAMAAGLGWLVLGLRRTREQGDDDGPDDGAVV